MSPYLRKCFLNEIDSYKLSFTHEQNHNSAWNHLERAHILSQFYVGPHLLVHLYMMIFAVKTRDWREALGQIPRLILAAPGSYFHRAPLGNTGGSDVGIFQQMEVPLDLQEILNKN
jgi:hypothetical protein